MQDHTMEKKRVLGVSKIAFKAVSSSSDAIHFNNSVNLTLTFLF
jgi:hypothetical protein